jgi:hypothetical protein
MNKTKLRINKKLNKRYLKEFKFHNYLKQTLRELGISI